VQVETVRVNDPFEMASSTSKSNNFVTTSSSSMTRQEEEAAREKLRSLGNRKAISSDDFNFDSSKSQEIE
jgi:hypothetical protein